MKGYKAFNPGLICTGGGRPMQYEIGKTYETETAICCESGIHFCEDPLAVWDYYPVIDDDGNLAEYAEVEADGKIDTSGNKSCATKVKIGARLSLGELINAEVEYVREKVKGDRARDTDDDVIASKAKNTKIGSSGDRAQIGSSGYRAKIGSSGDVAKIGSSGDWAQIGSSGDWAQIGSSGYRAQIGSSGDWAQIGSSGDGAKIGSSGDVAQITSTGERSVVMAAGHESKARAKNGSWITLAEWDMDESGTWYPKCVKTEQVDGERIKEDTFYKLIDGEFKEA